MTQPIQIKRRVRARRAGAARDQQEKDAAADQQASPMNTPTRAMPNSTPTVVLLFAVVSVAQPFTLGGAPGPIRNEYVPLTGCESAEMTRHDDEVDVVCQLRDRDLDRVIAGGRMVRRAGRDAFARARDRRGSSRTRPRRSR